MHAGANDAWATQALGIGGADVATGQKRGDDHGVRDV